MLVDALILLISSLSVMGMEERQAFESLCKNIIEDLWLRAQAVQFWPHYMVNETKVNAVCYERFEWQCYVVSVQIFSRDTQVSEMFHHLYVRDIPFR